MHNNGIYYDTFIHTHIEWILVTFNQCSSLVPPAPTDSLPLPDWSSFYFHVFFLGDPVSLNRVAPRCVCEGVLRGAWAPCQWMTGYWRKSLSTSINHIDSQEELRPWYPYSLPFENCLFIVISVCTPWCVHEGQRTALWSQFFPTLKCVSGIELRLPVLHGKPFCPLSHLARPLLISQW